MSLGVEIEDVYASSTLDLVGLNAEDRLRVDDKWAPVAYSDEEGVLIETVPMLAVGTNSQIRNALKSLDLKLEGAKKWYSDKSRRGWTRLNVLEEASGQEVSRSIVDGSIVPATLTGNNTFLENLTNTNYYRFDLKLTLVPGWELPEVNTATAALDRFGGYSDFTNNAGSRLARISRLNVGTVVATIGEMWIGIREEREGLTDYDPQYDCDNGFLYNGSTKVASANSYGTQVVETDFAGNSGHLLRLNFVPLAGGGANSEDRNGKYLVLMRVRFTQDGTANNAKISLQLQWGTGTGAMVQNPAVLLTGQSLNWYIVPLGYIQVPPWARSQSDPNTAFYGSMLLNFYADLLDGDGETPELQMDSVVYMPTDHLFTGAVQYGLSGVNLGDGMEIMTRADWHQYSYFIDQPGNLVETGAIQSFQDWALPTGTSRLVLAMQGTYSGALLSENPGTVKPVLTLYRYPVSGYPFET